MRRLFACGIAVAALGILASGCGGDGVDQQDVAEARRAAYTKGYDAGREVHNQELKEAALKYGMWGYRRGRREGARSVFGDLDVEAGRWYAVQVEVDRGEPFLGAALAMDEGLGYRVCPENPAEVCPAVLAADAPPASAPAPTVIVPPRSTPPLIPIPNPTPPIIDP